MMSVTLLTEGNHRQYRRGKSFKSSEKSSSVTSVFVNMKTSAAFWLLEALLLAAVSLSQAQTETKYFKAGGTLVLTPTPVSGPITGIVWKFSHDMLVEWAKTAPPLEYYPKIKGRSELNINTGVLEIWDLTAADIGLYSVEINNQVQRQMYNAVMIKEVAQPVASVTMLMYNSTCLSFTLSCDGDVEGAEPVTYFWKKGDGEWEESKKNMEIINIEEMHGVKDFTCRMKNPVSERDSKPISVSLFQIKPAAHGLWIIVLGAVMRSLTIVSLFVVIVYFVCQKREALCVCKYRKVGDNAV